MNKDTVFIIGGGESVKENNLLHLENQDVIAVNRAYFDLPITAKYFVTMDYSFVTKYIDRQEYNRLKNSSVTKIFIIPFDVDYIKEKDGKIVDIRFPLIYDLSLFNIIIKSPLKEPIHFNWSNFCNGHNSGYCALQLAALLGYRTINLIGIDLTFKGQTHFHNKYNTNKNTFKKKLDEYYKVWEKGIFRLWEEGYEINSYSSISRLNNITGVSYKGKIY